MDEGGEIRGGNCIGPWREPDARKGKEAENAKGGKRPWREKMSEVGRTGRKEGEGSGARRRGTRGPGGVYPGKPGPRGPGDTRTLRSMQGRKLPHVRKPLLLPPVIGPDILSRWMRSVSEDLGPFIHVARSCLRA
uniref:Uncharacterized protein n=1 Tax=uncultured marine group II/III euryarchaeote KM3_69_G09 TaxID=1456491 RepID=A0A075HGJ5_9EURY|nr:hypothetical protein [uncultured marine group II/III euryarchaeote KM3_69_G09]